MQILNELKLKNLSDLALLMPKKFSDYELKDSAQIGAKQAAKLTIGSCKYTHNGTRLFCECWCEHWGHNVVLVAFYPKAKMRKLLVSGKEVIVFGKVSMYANLVQFSSFEIIEPKDRLKIEFGFKHISDEQILSAKAQYLNANFFEHDGLPREIYEPLMELNQLSPKAVELYQSEQLLYILKYTEIFYYLKRLYINAAKPVFRDILSLHDISKWLKSLPFTPTNDQLKAIDDVRSDLGKARHKERVIMGDVGCGKSLVMFASALSAWPNRSVLMAPTSILATQLYTEACKMLPDYVNIVLLIGKQKPQNLSQAHFIISTHAALYADLGKISLVMIDEQHRFGAKQRAKLASLSGAHYVEFSATPIPRTTALINGGFYNYSFIKQMPFKKSIFTMCISPQQAGAMMEFIKSQIAQNHQAIVIYPLIEKGKSDKYKPLNEAIEWYRKHFNKVYYTHGKDVDKDSKLAEFAKDGEVLLSTTVVEVGISLPRLSVMVIVAPERYGLATLHQLRGRLCRAGIPGYCYLLSKSDFAPRLESFCNTIDGFEIAELDLQNRKSGDISQTAEQSGEQFKYFDQNTDMQIFNQAKVRLDNIYSTI